MPEKVSNATVITGARSPEKQNSTPQVSIVMPVYNSARYLREAIDSLLAQTYKNLEIICVNDGSRDDSLAILESYAARDTRIVVVDKKNEGAGAARNAGLGCVTGVYTCFMDSDDFLERTAVEQLVEAAEKHKVDAVIFKIDQYDDKTGTYSPNTWAISEEHIPARAVFRAAEIDNFYKHLVGFTVNKLYRSSFLLELELRFPAIGAHEDMPFTYLALSASDRSFYLDETLYHYRRSREGSLSDGTSNQYIYMLEALECLKEGLLKLGLWPEYEQTFVNYALHMCAWKNGELSRFRRLEFRDSCRTKWFTKLGISAHDEGYFFDDEDLAYIDATANMSPSRILAAKLWRRKLAISEKWIRRV